jgi:hypothetical protein
MEFAKMKLMKIKRSARLARAPVHSRAGWRMLPHSRSIYVAEIGRVLESTSVFNLILNYFNSLSEARQSRPTLSCCGFAAA